MTNAWPRGRRRRVVAEEEEVRPAAVVVELTAIATNPCLKVVAEWTLVASADRAKRL
jgi:hypothetical protein